MVSVVTRTGSGRDDQQRVDDRLGVRHDAGFGKAHATLALEVEWLGDDANGENAKLLALSAMTGAAPVLVPAGRPAVMNTMCARSK